MIGTGHLQMLYFRFLCLVHPKNYPLGLSTNTHFTQYHRHLTLYIGYTFLQGNEVLGLRRHTMLNLAVLFFVIAILVAVVGFAGIASISLGMVQMLFLIFVVLFIVSLIIGRRGLLG